MGLGTLRNVSFMKRENGCSIEEQLFEQNSIHRKGFPLPKQSAYSRRPPLRLLAINLKPLAPHGIPHALWEPSHFHKNLNARANLFKIANDIQFLGSHPRSGFKRTERRVYPFYMAHKKPHET